MQKIAKTSAITGEEKALKQKFTFAPQDGITEPTVIEADTKEEAETKFNKLIKTN